MPYSSMGSDLGDVNNDGLIDLFVTEMAATTHQKDQRSVALMRGSLSDPPDNSKAAPQYLRNALYINTGAGRCVEAACLAGISATGWTWSPRLEDLDNDGRLDLFVTNGMNRELHNADLIARKELAESLGEQARVEKASPELREEHLAFRNMGDLTFEDVSAEWGLNQKGISFGSAFGDLDGDGNLDLVYSNYEGGVTLLRNDSDTGHSIIVELRGTRSNRFGVGSTVRIETDSGTQVRTLVLARGVLSSSEPILHFGLGQGDADQAHGRLVAERAHPELRGPCRRQEVHGHRAVRPGRSRASHGADPCAILRSEPGMRPGGDVTRAPDRRDGPAATPAHAPEQEGACRRRRRPERRWQGRYRDGGHAE